MKDAEDKEVNEDEEEDVNTAEDEQGIKKEEEEEENGGCTDQGGADTGVQQSNGDQSGLANHIEPPVEVKSEPGEGVAPVDQSQSSMEDEPFIEAAELFRQKLFGDILEKLKLAIEKGSYCTYTCTYTRICSIFPSLCLHTSLSLSLSLLLLLLLTHSLTHTPPGDAVFKPHALLLSGTLKSLWRMNQEALDDLQALLDIPGLKPEVNSLSLVQAGVVVSVLVCVSTDVC